MNHPDAAAIVQNVPEPTGQVLTKEDLSRRWQVSIKTIDRLSQDRISGVRCFRIGRNVRFRLRDVEEYEQRRLTRQRPF